MELLNEKLTYCFEFLGDLVFPLTSEAFHRSTFSLLYFFNHKSSPLVGGQPAVGKTTLIRHAAALLGQPLFIRTMTRETGLHMLQTYLDVAIAVGVWFCFKSVDRVGMDVLSTLTRDLMHLESNHRYKESNAFFTFTSNLTGLNGQYMPQTFRVRCMLPKFCGNTERSNASGSKMGGKEQPLVELGGKIKLLCLNSVSSDLFAWSNPNSMS
ncbi:uncharacterized protein LOC131888581 [Tigriopus californicus]|nr:uncharacterized protein LOC131888581 [Tigriopus californicus]